MLKPDDLRTQGPEDPWSPDTPPEDPPAAEPIGEWAEDPAVDAAPPEGSADPVGEAGPPHPPETPGWPLPQQDPQPDAGPQTVPGTPPPPQAPPFYGQPPVQPGTQPPPVYYNNPQPPYGQPSYPTYYAPYPYVPPKKKLSTRTKVFIWVASVLAGLSIVAFGIFLVVSAVQNSRPHNALLDDLNDRFSSSQPPQENPRDEAPDEDRPDEPDDGKPDLDEDFRPDTHRETVEVTPNTEGIVVEPRPTSGEKTASQVYQQVVQSTVTVVTLVPNEEEESGYSVSGTGTGIFATADGYIITNAHVVNNSKDTHVDVITYDGEQQPAVVVGLDRTTDLAVLKTNGQDFTPAHFGDSDALVIGDEVIAIGNPGGQRYSASMTGGYISGLDREVSRYSASGMTYIQTDAAINPGNSGGPLVNMYGQVVGINSSKIVSDGYEGMGFAIPISRAKDILNQLLAGGYVQGRTRLGIRGSTVNQQMALYYGVPRGFMITEIDEISAFTGTQAAPGDVIVAIDGETVSKLEDISSLLSAHAPGDTVTVTLYRMETDETFDVEALLLEDKGETQQ